MPAFALIMAAGKGQRYGSYKQFIDLNDQVLVCHVINIFGKCKNIKKIILVVPRKKITYVKKLMKNNGFSYIKVIAGGKRRQDSVYNGLKTLGDRKGIAVVHDCVRPIIRRSTIERGIKLCKKYHAVIMGTPITDTVKLVSSNKVIKTIDRKHLFLTQTPQFFDLKILRKAYDTADPMIEYTDEAALLESAGLPVYLFKGDRLNIKITYRKDLQLISHLL
ncbi:2-C-methyl-D-erythritol 4-phosphate cytidylyltransferase [candidate division WOR-3 bacterium RBG_13_43_14]|uniref:2-C-methyl-D-erythritol 4-phosphate cytidylyltransferase n=1 Tax=candidate division WOR-3 bacterium RBG_13_43_14 TaxID=1802590 RepID=A0A1F4UAT1_UNCW3|nr:MAG: 2-C-methyl-D-erythritol 4-phosphate cytidylyltransferase [candidate division WOR-3 bacterium RBG_13_43_14]